MRSRVATWCFGALALPALSLCAACGWLSDADPGLSKIAADPAAPASKPEGDWTHVPVPPANGPKLHPLSMVVPIRLKPEPRAEVAGYLRIGAEVARSNEAVTVRDCPGGWYAIRPVGFVCAGPEVTLNGQHALVRALNVEPDRSKPMPYKYAFARAIAPNYLRIPSTAEQLRYEMSLERHLRSYGKLHETWNELEVGANDVPIDAQGLAIGRIPEHARPMDLSERYGGSGNDAVPWWLDGARKIPNLSSFKVPPNAAITNRVQRHAGLALIGTFVAGEDAGKRRFAITTDGRLVPADKLKADSGSPFHGGVIQNVGLPLAFPRASGARFYRLEGKSFEAGSAAPYREIVPLTGRSQMAGGERYVETRSGEWLNAAEAKIIVKPSSLPSYAKKGQLWIDISLLNQTLTLWRGADPIYATLVSTGRDGTGEPGKTMSTPQGTFRIVQKHVTTTMDSAVADHEFELRDVPWVMYFKGGYALHAAYWHDDFGRARSHGCVNLSPIDARYLFENTSPGVPEHWHAAYAGDATEAGTLINIHP
jgi:lipoprotein-anchoring transpeptidase ErfK/SrfK